jgi:hypothetical protein
MLILVFALALPAGALIQTDLVYDIDDTYVNSSSGDTNLDGLSLITGKPGAGTLESWFRLNLNDATGYYVVGATLRTYVYSATESKQYSIHNASSAAWTETDLTWNNKPSYGGAAAQNTIGSTGWWSWDILTPYSDAFSQGVGYTSYALQSGESGTFFIEMEDRENSGSTGNAPYLNLTMMIPEAHAISPPDSHSTYDTAITFTYNTTDAGNIVNCSLVLDGNVNMTNSSVTENTTSSFLRSGIFPGSHTWLVRCYDYNRQTYEISTPSKNLNILAKAEWTNPDSSTPLDIGTAVLGTAGASGNRQVYSNNSNNDVQVTCSGGDCGTITTNWTPQTMAGGDTLTAYFNCSASAAGSYHADFEVQSDQDTSADTLTVNCTIIAPDLRINLTNITFSTNSPSEGQTVTVRAGIYNIGTSEATGAVVRFYEGNYSIGTQIGSDHTITLSPGASTAVEQNWTAKVGTYDIYIVLDPPLPSNGSIAESNESNNHAYNTISTSMWTIFVGNVTGSLALQTADAKTLMKWNVTDTTNSIIYVTDTDSNPDFASLTAFSRNTTGAYMSNDFTELDSAINTTSYPDSANLTFTSAGSPVRQEVFTIFGKAIENVPIINSTNSTTFITGILWDSSDDSNSNHQFDNSSNEDIVFVTRVNQTKAGKYGTYDYEISVPANLKNYKEPDVLTVTFYTEIK